MIHVHMRTRTHAPPRRPHTRMYASGPRSPDNPHLVQFSHLTTLTSSIQSPDNPHLIQFIHMPRSSQAPR